MKTGKQHYQCRSFTNKILNHKVFYWKDFTFSPVERFSPNVVTEFNKGSKVNFDKMVRVHNGSKIKVRGGARLNIESNAKINYNCIIACHDKIEIGEGTELWPVYLYENGYDYKAVFLLTAIRTPFVSGPIIIGNN